MSKHTDTTRRIGHVWVDSGQPEDEECGHCGDVVDAGDIYDGLCPECQLIGDDNDEDEDR